MIKFTKCLNYTIQYWIKYLNSEYNTLGPPPSIQEKIAKEIDFINLIILLSTTESLIQHNNQLIIENFKTLHTRIPFIRFL